MPTPIYMSINDTGVSDRAADNTIDLPDLVEAVNEGTSSVEDSRSATEDAVGEIHLYDDLAVLIVSSHTDEPDDTFDFSNMTPDDGNDGGGGLGDDLMNADDNHDNGITLPAIGTYTTGIFDEIDTTSNFDGDFII